MWMNKFMILSVQARTIFLISILASYVTSLVPKALAQDNITGGKEIAPSGIDWNTPCTDLD
jgi:hypothetical protein